MSNSERQTRISLRLRKRNQERSEDALPINKKQAKVFTEDTQLRKDLPAFSAPMDEERKVNKRTNHEATTTDNKPIEKPKRMQTNIKEILKLSSSSTAIQQPIDSEASESDSAITITTEETDKSHAQTTENTKPNTIASTTLAKATSTKKTKHHETLPIEKIKTHAITPTTTTQTELKVSTDISPKPCSGERPSSSILQSPTRSSILEPSSIEKQDSLSDDLSIDNGSLPTPMTTPETKRIIYTTAPLSPSTVSDTSSSKLQGTTSVSPSELNKLHDKSLLPKLEKERIADERTTLDKLVSALDITLTFHAARNVAAFFHKIQPMLRNSTKKNITISHLCKILFLAPGLYDVQTKLLKEFGKEVEAHQVSIGNDWEMPLTGKSIQERKDLMTKRSSEYFEEHKKENASIPELELPSLDNVVNKKKWLEKAKLPDRVRSILELQEKRKSAKEEKSSQPRIEPKGSAKDRAKALLDRIRNKQKK